MDVKSGVLWMGDIKEDMDEAWIKEAFANMGFTVSSVKEIFQKVTNERATYCFVDFDDVNTAREVFIKVNGEPIPGTDGRKFKLNRSEYGRGVNHGGDETEHSLFVGDLTADVSNNHLLDFFRSRYPSVKAANVVVDDQGNSKGFGFVRFFNEEEINRATTEMQGVGGLGKRAIRVNKANRSKAQGQQLAEVNQQFPGWMQMQMNYMQQMYQFMRQCQQYAEQAAQHAGWSKDIPSLDDSTEPPPVTRRPAEDQIEEEEEEELEYVDPYPPVDIDALNKEILEQDDELFFEMEASRWDFDIGVSLTMKQEPIRNS